MLNSAVPHEEFGKIAMLQYEFAAEWRNKQNNTASLRPIPGHSQCVMVINTCRGVDDCS